MSKRSEILYLGDMLDYARRARTKIAGVTREQFEANEDLQIIVGHLIQIVGEAASRVSAATSATHPEIAWDRIAGMRHKIVHDYFEIDVGIVWDAATNDLPELIASLERFVPSEPA
ncbi:MAG TPA: HepT-like ribonuclease domain-containing protein [Thermoanaerobaculia bacterium]